MPRMSGISTAWGPSGSVPFYRPVQFVGTASPGPYVCGHPPGSPGYTHSSLNHTGVIVGKRPIGAGYASSTLIVPDVQDRPVKASPSGGLWPALTGLRCSLRVLCYRVRTRMTLIRDDNTGAAVRNAASNHGNRSCCFLATPAVTAGLYQRPESTTCTA